VISDPSLAAGRSPHRSGRRLTIYAAALNVGLAGAFLALRLQPVFGGGEAEIPPDWLEIVALLAVILAPAALAVLSLQSHASLLGGAVVASMWLGVIALSSIGLLVLVVGLLYLVAFLRRTDRGAETVWRRGLVFVLVLGATQGALFGLRMFEEPACWEFGTAPDGSRTVRAIPLAKTVARDGTVTYTGEGVTMRRTVGPDGATSGETTQSSSGRSACTSDTTTTAEGIVSLALTGLAVGGSLFVAGIRGSWRPDTAKGPASAA